MEYHAEQEKIQEEKAKRMATTVVKTDNNSGERTPSNAGGKDISNPILKSATETNH